MLIEEMQTAVRGRHINNSSHAKTEQDAALHPSMRVPFAIAVAFGGANLAAIERLFELGEELEVLLLEGMLLLRCQVFDSFTQDRQD